MMMTSTAPLSAPQTARWQPGLAGAFGHLMARLLADFPGDDLYWFLISKGYKTYLLLTNNFYNYYPNVNGGDERYRRVTEAYCEALFPEAFDRKRMLLDFGNEYVCLKGDVA